MKRLFGLISLFIFFLTGTSLVKAEMMPIEPGTVNTYQSNNGNFQLKVLYDELGMVRLTLFNEDKEIWSQLSGGHPGNVAISDDGKTVVVTTFGWEDERGCDGFVIFNEKGDLAKEVKFGSEDNPGMLKWVDFVDLSPDGKYIAVGQDFEEKAGVTVYDAATGAEVWSQEAGYPDAVTAAMSENAAQLLLATRNVAEMMFVLLDKEGKVIGSKTVADNFSYEAPKSVRFTNGLPEIYDLKTAAYVPLQF